MKLKRSLIIILLLVASNSFAFLGTELGPLLKLVAGQVTEIERLTETLNVARENRELLIQINKGINRTVTQIESIQSIIDRADGLDPRAIRSISELNDYLERVKDSKLALEEVLSLKTRAAGVAVGQAAVQSETSYKMGQEMISTGSNLAEESRSASPGRAAQITAASGSAQMLASGVTLQTLSQMVQLQAMSLELQRSQIEQRSQERQASRGYFEAELTNQRKSKKRRSE